MRLFMACLLLVGVGCSAPQPPHMPRDLGESIQADLVRLGAKVTATDERTIYLSLRHVHARLGELSFNIEGDFRTRKDFNDFRVVGETVAAHLLKTSEHGEFRSWFQAAVADSSRPAQQTRYAEFKVTLSLRPPLLLFTRTPPPE